MQSCRAVSCVVAQATGAGCDGRDCLKPSPPSAEAPNRCFLSCCCMLLALDPMHLHLCSHTCALALPYTLQAAAQGKPATALKSAAATPAKSSLSAGVGRTAGTDASKPARTAAAPASTTTASGARHRVPAATTPKPPASSASSAAPSKRVEVKATPPCRPQAISSRLHLVPSKASRKPLTAATTTTTAAATAAAAPPPPASDSISHPPPVHLSALPVAAISALDAAAVHAGRRMAAGFSEAMQRQQQQAAAEAEQAAVMPDTDQCVAASSKHHTPHAKPATTHPPTLVSSKPQPSDPPPARTHHCRRSSSTSSRKTTGSGTPTTTSSSSTTGSARRPKIPNPIAALEVAGAMGQLDRAAVVLQRLSEMAGSLQSAKLDAPSPPEHHHPQRLESLSPPQMMMLKQPAVDDSSALDDKRTLHHDRFLRLHQRLADAQLQLDARVEMGRGCCLLGASCGPIRGTDHSSSAGEGDSVAAAVDKHQQAEQESIDGDAIDGESVPDAVFLWASTLPPDPFQKT